MRCRDTVITTLAALALGGCAIPAHSNALVFATNTTIALDVSAAPSTGTPNITLGYKRQEFALVPLVANQGSSREGDRQSFACEKSDSDNSTCVLMGREGQNKDAYSVLASLEGGVSTTTGTGSTELKSTIGQYFATGLAARALAEKGGAALVNPTAQSPMPVEAAKQLAAIEDKQKTNIAKIDAYVGTGDFETKLKALLDKAYPGSPPARKLVETAADKAELDTILAERTDICAALGSAADILTAQGAT